jgi:succinate dehydrogenase/fumarate reductase flavoprotein subunit
MLQTLDGIGDGAAYDIVVVGAGGGGMAAALFAAIENQKVLLIERTGYLGGTTALSAATTWIPNSMHAPSVPGDDSFERASAYLTGVVGNHSSATMREAFLRSGPEAIATLEAKSSVQFRPYATHPDYEQQFDGATLRGRALEPLPFDGRALGRALHAIRPPIPEFTIFGGMMVDRTDINHLLGLTKSAGSFLHATKLLARYGLDRMAGARGSRLVMGNALIGRMLKSLLDRGVDIVTDTNTTALTTDAGGVSGLVAESGGVTRTIKASRGVVLAAGGYGRHPKRRAEMLHAPVPVYSPAAPGHTGAMQDLALGLGARFGEGNADNAFWAPVSVRTRTDGSTAVFPHFVLDRSKPGTVCVNQRGDRFVNESNSYHVFARAMFDAHKISPCIPCFIITDAVGLKKYGLGMVRMGTRNLSPYLDDGYLTDGATVAELATRLNIDPNHLQRTIADMNAFAVTGVDPKFGRGTTGYHRANGDASHGPNPTLGPIATGPYYAVKLFPGDIGAATGLVIDPWAQVVRDDNTPIGRLYACGNEANSIMGGTYPGPGITIGPAITFAYRAIKHAVHAGDEHRG